MSDHRYQGYPTSGNSGESNFSMPPPNERDQYNTNTSASNSYHKGQSDRGNSGGDYKKGGGGGYQDNVRKDTIYVSGLPSHVDQTSLMFQFGMVGAIKMNEKNGLPQIYVYRDRACALATFESKESAAAAVEWFRTNEIDGTRVEVRLARSDEKPQTMMRGGGGGGRFQQRSSGGRGRDERSRRDDYGGDRRERDRDREGRDDNRGGNRPDRRDDSAPSSQVKPEDWVCSNCSNKNFGWRDSCNRCKVPKGETKGGGGGGSGGPAEDWFCSCGNKNFAWRQVCNRCSTPKGATAPAKSEHHRGGGGGGNSNNNNSGALDWVCAICANKNFGWRVECNRCKAPKEGMPPPAPTMMMGGSNNSNNPSMGETLAMQYNSGAFMMHGAPPGNNGGEAGTEVDAFGQYRTKPF